MVSLLLSLSHLLLLQINLTDKEPNPNGKGTHDVEKIVQKYVCAPIALFTVNRDSKGAVVQHRPLKVLAIQLKQHNAEDSTTQHPIFTPKDGQNGNK
jgi:hypothetical protein